MKDLSVLLSCPPQLTVVCGNKTEQERG